MTLQIQFKYDDHLQVKSAHIYPLKYKSYFLKIPLTNSVMYTGNEATFICRQEQDNPRKA